MRLAAATFARSDYSSFRPLLRALDAATDFELSVWVGGMHLEPRFGETVRELIADGLRVDCRLDMPVRGDTPSDWAETLGRGVRSMTAACEAHKPDILILVGDRLELLAAVSAAAVAGVPIAHISGGDVTEGAIDNQVRFAVSRMSHLHFVSAEEHAHRLLRSGEEPWRVHVTGDPALDELEVLDYLNQPSIEAVLGLPIERPLMLLTYHPVTLDRAASGAEIEAVCSAVEALPGTCVITMPNADPGHQPLIQRLNKLVQRRPRTCLIASLGQRRYYSLLKLADVMIGNSSSAIWEAPSFALPAINIGERQAGRRRAGNVIDAPADSDAIIRAVRRALDPSFRVMLEGQPNPYGDGQAVPRILAALRAAPPRSVLLKKKIIEENAR